MENKANKNRQRGKQFERKIAESFNGIRVGILGKTDVLTNDGKYAIECKSRKSFVASSWMQQSIKNAGSKIPLLVVHVTNQKHEDNLVILRMKDFKNLTGLKEFEVLMENERLIDNDNTKII